MKVFRAAAIAELVLLVCAAVVCVGRRRIGTAANRRRARLGRQSRSRRRASTLRRNSSFRDTALAPTFRRGRLWGYGPASMLVGTADTQNRPVKAIVITQDYGAKLSQWQIPSAGYLPAILQPKLSDVYNCWLFDRQLG